ncbi:retrotransposon hot spot (RHS) protein, putative [Trypanosoma cruzi marinkellei]|uniref:Retrotransposon hot spot (RHS) protein, putative n=1 Tax=Trypanosoma cruzi marinkellei TaxID=85056 RepID=K2NUT1_TRYCR|nr:retrotransposon hot spot (RHS) protein, putative [Trypanosoma cruzi marinkellei]
MPSCIWCASSAAPSHRVDDSLAVLFCYFCAYCPSLSRSSFDCLLGRTSKRSRLGRQVETMPEGHMEGNADNGTIPAPTVPQGLCRARARWVSRIDRDQPAAARRRVEETRRPQPRLCSQVKDLLLEGVVDVELIRLNDFLRAHCGPTAVVDEAHNVWLGIFLRDPYAYVQDQQLLGQILDLEVYQLLQNTQKLVMDTKKLNANGVRCLEHWRGFERKDMCTPLTRLKLDSALKLAPEEGGEEMLVGFYSSVYNARWSHIMEVPGGEWLGMETRMGKPAQSWTYKAVGRTLEKDDVVEQFSVPRLRLMVLTSEKGWPYSWMLEGPTRDCYVNCEVERVWQIVKGDLTEWFSTHGGNDFTPKRRVLIGMSGIGKSMAAGSYLLYQLLHYDVGKLQVVVYRIAERSYLFDKTTQTVTHYAEDALMEFMAELSGRGMRGYFIHNVAEPSHEPSVRLLPRGWGMITVTPPEERDNRGRKKQLKGRRIVMRCPEENDVKAMCVWKKRNSFGGQAIYWQEVRGYMNKVGPILRDLFSERDANTRPSATGEPWDGLPYQMHMTTLE